MMTYQAKLLVFLAVTLCSFAWSLGAPWAGEVSREGKLDLGIIVDGSGSMKGHGDELTRAVLAVIDELERGDWVLPVLLSTDPELLRDRQDEEPGILITDAASKHRLRSILTAVRPIGEYSYHYGALRVAAEHLVSFRNATDSEGNPCALILGDGLMEPGPWGVDITPQRMEELYSRYPEARSIPIYLFRIGGRPESSPGKRDISEVLPALPSFRMIPISAGESQAAQAESVLTRISSVLRSFRTATSVEEKPAPPTVHLPWERVASTLSSASRAALHALGHLWPFLAGGVLILTVVILLSRRAPESASERVPPFEEPAQVTLEVHQEKESGETFVKEFHLTVPPEGKGYVIGSDPASSDIPVEDGLDLMDTHGVLRVSASGQVHYSEEPRSLLGKWFRRERPIFDGDEIALTPRTTITVHISLAAAGVASDELLDEGTL